MHVFCTSVFLAVRGVASLFQLAEADMTEEISAATVAASKLEHSW
jgi:hypothetical protein